MANVVTQHTVGTGNHHVVTVQTSAVQGALAPMQEVGRRYVKAYQILGKLQTGIGALSIGIAVLALILTIVVGYPVASGTSYTSTGIWCGVIFFVTGALAISASKYPIASKINATMVLAIFSVFFAFTMIIIEGNASTSSRESLDDFDDSGYYGNRYYPRSRNENVNYRITATVIYACHVILAILAATELVVALVTSGYCCAATCCGSRYQPSSIVTTTTTTAPVAVQQPQMVVQPCYVPVNQQGYAAGAPVYPIQPHAPVPLQSGHAPQPAYIPQPAYAPQPVQAPQPAYVPQGGYQQATTSQPGPPMEAPPAYSPPTETSPMYPTKS